MPERERALRADGSKGACAGDDEKLTQWTLRERLKELECLYSISRTLQNAEAGTDELLHSIVEILPLGFQYPDLAAARVRVDDRVYETPSFPGDAYVLKADIPSGGGIEVAYPPSVGTHDPSPFLPEETKLIEKAAAEISLTIERRRAAEEKTRLEIQLRHSDRLATVGTLAAGIAHELNEPLATILGFAQLIQKEPGLPKQASSDLAPIIDASLRAREIVRKLLLFARGAPARVEECDLNELAREGLAFVEPRCKSGGIELRLELTDATITIRADPTQLTQVLVNLSVNAIQAMPAGGRLTVRTQRAAAGASLIIADTGVGMSHETMEKIFVPFFTTKGTGGGTGLGLAVVHGIVTSLGGSISLESAPGKGSRFEVIFPLPAGNEDAS